MTTYVEFGKAKLYSCPEDVVVHLQSMRTQRLILSVRGVKGRDLRFSLLTPETIQDTPVYGTILGEWESPGPGVIRLVAKVDDHHEELCRLIPTRHRILRIELLGETPR